MAKKKSKKYSLFKLHLKHFIYFFIVISIIITAIFLTKEQPAEAAASFYLNRVTPANEVKRGGPIVYDVMVLGQNAGDSVNTGIEFDRRKLRVDNIDAGELGSINWNPIADNGDKSRIVISNGNVSTSGDHKQFARVHFTIIDQTDEKDAQGRGFVELCSIFDPGTSAPTSIPNTSIPQPTNSGNNPTTQPTLIQNTPIPTKVNEPIPTAVPVDNLDMSKLCIPLEVNGSPADKMDMILMPVNYAPNEYGTFIQHAQLAIQRLGETNLSSYRNEVLSKMNWYVINTSHSSIPAEYRNKKIESAETYNFINSVLRLCPHDRHITFVNAQVLENPDGAKIGGSATLYGGLIFAAQSVLDPNSNIFAHEWGHAAAGLIDEYDAGKWFTSNDPTTGYNCTKTPNNLNPGPDPCPWGMCDNSLNDPKFKQVCPQWDCNQMECDALQKELFANAGCYQRCSSQNGYRPAPISVMDAVFPGVSDDITKFNGPSLYSIIQYTFTKYK